MTNLYDFQLISADTGQDIIAPLKGHVVLLVTMSTGTQRLAYMHAIQQLHTQYRDRGFSVIGVPEKGPWRYRDGYRTEQQLGVTMLDTVEDMIKWQQGMAWLIKTNNDTPDLWMDQTVDPLGNPIWCNKMSTSTDYINPVALFSTVDANTATQVADIVYPISQVEVTVAQPAGPTQHPLFTWIDTMTDRGWANWEKLLFDSTGKFVKAYQGYENEHPGSAGIETHISRLLPHPNTTGG